MLQQNNYARTKRDKRYDTYLRMQDELQDMTTLTQPRKIEYSQFGQLTGYFQKHGMKSEVWAGWDGKERLRPLVRNPFRPESRLEVSINEATCKEAIRKGGEMIVCNEIRFVSEKILAKMKKQGKVAIQPTKFTGAEDILLYRFEI